MNYTRKQKRDRLNAIVAILTIVFGIGLLLAIGITLYNSGTPCAHYYCKIGY